jgi:acyl-CoA thioesterase I
VTRLCFIGDSLTNGTGDDEALGWPGRIVAKARAQGHDVTLYNLGIRRDTSADIASRWRAEVERRLPPMYRAEGRLAFCFGTNDCADDGNVDRAFCSSARWRTPKRSCARRWRLRRR